MQSQVIGKEVIHKEKIEVKVVLIYGSSLPRYQDTIRLYDFPLCFPHEILMSLRIIYKDGCNGYTSPL